MVCQVQVRFIVSYVHILSVLVFICILYFYLYFICKQEVVEVSQIDLVPTLSLLLGIPIPYSNLGSVISHVLYNTKSLLPEESLLQAMQSNQHQISTYLQHYNQVNVW